MDIINNMTRLAIIPARAGSVRFPNKNWALLDGKPLWRHTIDVARDCFDDIVFTSDSDTLIKSVAYLYDDINTHIRPSCLATSTSKVIDTVCWIHSMWANTDEIWLLLPTCPLRTKDDVLNAQKLLGDTNEDGVISITDYEFPPQLGLLSEDGLITDWHESKPWQNGNTRSQDHYPVYRPNGALYGMKREHFHKHQNFYEGRIEGYYMPRERSVDIDTELDLKIAEQILHENR